MQCKQFKFNEKTLSEMNVLFTYCNSDWDDTLQKKLLIVVWVNFDISCILLPNNHCVKSVQMQSFFWSVFSYICIRKNCVFGHFSHSEQLKLFKICKTLWRNSKTVKQILCSKLNKLLHLFVPLIPLKIRWSLSIIKKSHDGLLFWLVVCDFLEI